MKKTLCALISLWLFLCFLGSGLSEAATETHVATLPEKLVKQVNVGSGFAGTLSLSLERKDGETTGIATREPLVFDVSYINLWESSAVLAERRVTLTLLEEEQPRMNTEFSIRDNRYYLKSDLLGESWYLLPRPDLSEAKLFTGQEDTKESETEDAAFMARLSESLSGLISQSAMPSLFSFALPAVLGYSSQSGKDLEEAFSTYTTKLDLWIEAYKQTSELGKLPDGTTTMRAQYEIPVSAIKSQLKQMLMDVLADQELLSRLGAMLPENYGTLLLNPQSQPFYFFAIDALPLEGPMIISRTVSVKGETLDLNLSLPFYDQTAGAVILSYDRKAGERNDLPDENVISLESQDLSLRLEYQGYHTMTGVEVYQGTILRTRRDQPDGTPSPILSAAFTLSHEEQSAVNEEKMESLSHNYKLTLEPELTKQDAQGGEVPLTEEELAGYYAVPAFDLETTVTFSSKQESTAATYLDMIVSLNGEELPQTFEATFSGKTCASWLAETVNPRAAVEVAAMSSGELTPLLAQAGLKAGAYFLPFLSLPEAGAEEGAPGEGETEGVPGEGTPADGEAEDVPGEDASAEGETNVEAPAMVEPTAVETAAPAAEPTAAQ